MSAYPTQRLQRGLTLVEMMVAMVLGLMVTGGIITVFISTSSSNKAQKQLATLQEAGRYAVARLRDDVSMINSQYCSASGGEVWQKNTGAASLDTLRSPTVFANGLLLGALDDVTTPWGAPYPNQPAQAFAIPPYLYMRGYDCTTGSCTPVDPSAGGTGIPAQGTAVGNRVVGSAVLTMRYVDPSAGWSIGKPGGSTISVVDNNIQNVSIAPLDHEPQTTPYFQAGDLAMLADCSYSEVFAVNVSGNVVTPLAVPGNFQLPAALSAQQGARLFNLSKAFKTVTYYLRVVDAGNGRTTGALIRRINGVDHELVRGIERLDFRYGVLHQDGTTEFLSAQQVDNSTICPFQPASVAIDPANRTGCLWRGIKSLEVSLLVSGQRQLASLSNAQLSYTYVPDNTTAPVQPNAHSIQPQADQGFPLRLLRREFTALVPVRNFNP